MAIGGDDKAGGRPGQLAETTKFLTEMPSTPIADLRKLVSKLPQPNYQLLGRPPAVLPLPANIVCFQRRKARDLNKPRRGRALHHRFVLICALRTAVTVCVDDRDIRLKGGEGLLVFPFQFHHYTGAQRQDLSWLFVTFELQDAEPLAALRYRPFALTPQLRTLAAELVESFETERTEELSVLLLALFLARLRRLKIAPPAAAAEPEPGLMLRINQIAQPQRAAAPPGIKEIARALAISPSHLRARFKASCGVSIGRIEVDHLVRKVADSGVTVVLVEHDMKMVMNLSDRILVLDYGKKLAEGTGEEVRKNPDVIAAYLGAHA